MHIYIRTGDRQITYMNVALGDRSYSWDLRLRGMNEEGQCPILRMHDLRRTWYKEDIPLPEKTNTLESALIHLRLAVDKGAPRRNQPYDDTIAR